jgi:hypothetical protein
MQKFFVDKLKYTFSAETEQASDTSQDQILGPHTQLPSRPKPAKREASVNTLGNKMIKRY